MNLGQFRTAVDRRTGVAVDTTTQTEWINEVLQSIALEAAWPWLLQLTQFAGSGFSQMANESAYSCGITVDNALNYKLQSVVYVKDSNGTIWDPAATLDVLTFGQSDSHLIPQFGDGGHFYAVYGSEVILSTQPTATTIDVRWYSSETTLTNDSDSPLLPFPYHQAVVELVSLLVMERRGTRVDSVKAKGYADIYKDLISKMKRQALRNISQARAPRIRPGSGW